MAIKCREAIISDIEGLNAVMGVISDNGIHKEKAPELITKIAQNPEKYLMVAEDTETGEILGSLFGMVFEDICDTGAPILLIENVAVLPNLQRSGVGTEMFEKIEAWGVSHHCHYVMLVSGNQRTGAHHFYKKIGYEEAKGFKKYLSDETIQYS